MTPWLTLFRLRRKNLRLCQEISPSISPVLVGDLTSPVALSRHEQNLDRETYS